MYIHTHMYYVRYTVTYMSQHMFYIYVVYLTQVVPPGDRATAASSWARSSWR